MTFNYAIIDMTHSTIVVEYEDEWDYEEYQYDENPYWHIYREPNGLPVTEELVEYVQENVQGDLYTRETGAEILQLLTKRIEELGLSTVITTGE